MGPVICVLFTNKHLLTGLQKSEPSSYRCNNFYELIVINEETYKSRINIYELVP